MPLESADPQMRRGGRSAPFPPAPVPESRSPGTAGPPPPAPSRPVPPRPVFPKLRRPEGHPMRGAARNAAR